jgi:hypothetical protein
MDIPPWHVGHVLRKLMQDPVPEITRAKLAETAHVDPMTVTNILKGGNYEHPTLEAICRALGVTVADVMLDVDRSNNGRTHSTIQFPAQRRRLMDRDQATIDAEQYARRIGRLPSSVQTAVFTMIRAYEEVLGLLNQSRKRE